MPFVKATIVFKPANIGTGIKCQLRRTRNASVALSFFINASVSKEMGLADGDKLEVLIGDGGEHGLIRLRKNNSSGEAAAQERTSGKGPFFHVRLGHQPAFIDRSEPSAWCQWEKVEDGWVEIVLPRWADETAPNRKPANGASVQPIKPGSAEPARGPGRPPKNVTANLMGDPPPGRREMLKTIGNLKA